MTSNSNGLVLYEKLITGGALFDSIKNAINTGKYFITLALRCEDGSAPWWKLSPYGGPTWQTNVPTIDLTIKYKTNPQNYQFVNKIENTENSDSIIVTNMENLTTTKISSGTTLGLTLNTNYSTITNLLPFVINWNSTGLTEKQSNWIANSNGDYSLRYNFVANLNYLASKLTANFSPTKAGTLQTNFVDEGINGTVSTNISFKDPWYYFKDQDNNWQKSDIFKDYISPLVIQNNSSTSYGGVFLNQTPDPNNPNKPYYSVKTTQTQSINLGGSYGIHDFYFLNWSRDYISGQPSGEFQDSMALETGVVFKQQNAVVNANFKSTQLSSENNAYNNTSQRKFIRLHNNEMMHVYTSMNKTWLETSTDNGTTWQLRNGGKPLTQQESKLPSVCQLEQSRIIIALQEMKTDGGYKIKVLIYDLAYDMIVAESIAAEQANKLYTEDANPVVACPREGIQNFLVIWEEAHYGEFQPGGLYYRYGKLVSGPSVSWISYTDLITGTDLNSHVPALVTDFSYNSYPINYKLAYEQHSSGNIAAIHYRNISATATTVTVPSATNISANAGFSKNTKPSLIAASNGARISWIGYRVIDEEETQQCVVFVDPSNLSRYWNFGANVQSTSINKSDVCYSIAWGRSNSLPIQFADSYTLSNIFTIGDLTGKDVQLSNGTTRTTMRAMAFNSNSQPYYFNNKQLYLSKVNLADIGSGREGVVCKDNAQFYFAVGDLRVNDQLVKFIEFDDSVSFYSNQRLNEFLLSEPFSLTNNSNFTYSVQYGITDSAAAVNALDNDDFINFKVELIDDQTGELLGLFDNITYTKASVDQYENIAYQVITEGIGNRTVRLRLVTANNFDPKYSLTDRYAEGNALLKSSFKQVSFQGSLKVDNYELSQNYPNPFNPTTTINYQIKEDGFVTLKLYDILGAEVRTLLNEEKTKGRYSYNFNGSDLATGVYIYQLKVNDFVSSKKLMLLK